MSTRSKVIRMSKKTGIGLTRDRSGYLRVTHKRSRRFRPKISSMINVITDNRGRGVIR